MTHDPQKNDEQNFFEDGVSAELIKKAVMTKSDSWDYEEEFRTLLPPACLDMLSQKKMACLKDFNGKQTWFLRLNPASIREVVFGLYARDNLKSKIGELIKHQDLTHIKLFQAEESETYTLKLNPLQE